MIFPELTFCPLRYQAIHHGDAIAVQQGTKTLSYRALDQYVSKFCQQHSADFPQGQHLLWQPADALTTIVVLLGCLRKGWVLCPINPAFPPEQAAAYQQKVDAVPLQFTLADAAFESDNTDGLLLHDITIAPQQRLDLIATSGSSGVPKAVAHCYENHYYNVVGSQGTLPLQQGDGWLLSLPLFHVGGLAIIWRCVLTAATMVLPEQGDSPAQTLQKSAQHQAYAAVTHLSLVNTQLFRLLHAGFDLHKLSVRYILLGGGVVSPTLVHEVQQLGIEVLTTYGMTEMGSQICTGAPIFTDDGLTSGVPLPFLEVMLSYHGEILVRGKTLALGYYNAGQLTTLVDSEGWFHTGDKGRWEGSQLQVIGRMDNMFISGGENIHPEEIEQCLLTIPFIVQAVVVAIPNLEFGQRPVAYVQTVDNVLNEQELKRILRDRIAGFKVPDSICLFPEDVVAVGIKVNRRYFTRLALETADS